MKKKLIACIIVLAAILLVSVFVVTDRKEKTEEKIVTEEMDGMMTLQEVRDSLPALMEKMKNGGFSNLEFDQFIPAVTDKDEIYNLSIKYPERYRNYDNKKLVEEQIKVLKAFYGEELDYDCITDWQKERPSYKKLMKSIEDGTYNSERVPYIVYDKGEGKIHAQVEGGLTSLWIDTGTKGVSPSGNYKVLDKTYYKYATDGSLEEKYQTEDGEMSVAQAVEELEKYFNEDFPIENDGGFQYRASKIQVLEMKKGIYGFDIGYRRAYDGVLFEYEDSGTVGMRPEETADMTESLLTGKGKVPFFNGFVGNAVVTHEGEAVKRVVSPENALQFISQKIGNNTTYHVSGMELSYKEVMKEGYSEATLVWKVDTSNKTDKKKTIFYVNAVTGELISRVKG